MQYILHTMHTIQSYDRSSIATQSVWLPSNTGGIKPHPRLQRRRPGQHCIPTDQLAAAASVWAPAPSYRTHDARVRTPPCRRETPETRPPPPAAVLGGGPSHTITFQRVGAAAADGAIGQQLQRYDRPAGDSGPAAAR